MDSPREAEGPAGDSRLGRGIEFPSGIVCGMLCMSNNPLRGGRVLVMNRASSRLEPNHIVPPGETIREFLEELDMTQAELARRMDRPESAISQIINGKKRIEPETALQLEAVLGITAGFWARLEANYRVNLAQQKQRERADLTT